MTTSTQPLLRTPHARDTGVWDYPVFALEEALAREGVTRPARPPSALAELIGKVVGRSRLGRRLVEAPKSTLIVPLMGPAERRLFPAGLTSNVVPLCYDCWPNNWNRWESLLRRYRVSLAFFTSQQSAEAMRQRIPRLDARWLPEATDPADYDAGAPLTERHLDVLELGRRNEIVHRQLTPALSLAGKEHLFQEPGKLVFPTRDGLRAGLADTRISICYPASVTSPEKAGHVETLTHRYLEAIASRCLVVGRGPGELEELFGFDPVVRLDDADPLAHVLTLLAGIDEYQQDVDRNYQRLLEVGTWQRRVAQLLEVIAICF